MQSFNLETLHETLQKSGHNYLEFLRTPNQSMGIYVLPVGGIDPQQPHSEEEVYYVVSGKGRFLCGEEDNEVHTGNTFFVPAHVPHRFHSIESTLTLLVFFAPAEGSQSTYERI